MTRLSSASIPTAASMHLLAKKASPGSKAGAKKVTTSAASPCARAIIASSQPGTFTSREKTGPSSRSMAGANCSLFFLSPRILAVSQKAPPVTSPSTVTGLWSSAVKWNFLAQRIHTALSPAIRPMAANCSPGTIWAWAWLRSTCHCKAMARWWSPIIALVVSITI